MSKYLHWVVFFFIPLNIFGQIADFTKDKYMGCDTLRITFTNLSIPDIGESIDEYDFYWSFENNRKRNANPITYLFRAHGKDTILYVTLTMKHKNIQGKESTKRDSIRIRPVPNAWFQVIDHPIDTLLYTFRSGKAPSDTIVYQYQWYNRTTQKNLAIHPNANAIETINGKLFRRDTLIYLFTENQTGYHTIRLKVTDWFGCQNIFDSTILISPTLVIPKFFTPNGDGLNDYFYVATNGKDIFLLEIFNSRGQRIFHSLSRSILWEGIIENSGQMAPAGTYYYYIQSKSGAPYSAKGFVVLLRNP